MREGNISEFREQFPRCHGQLTFPSHKINKFYHSGGRIHQTSCGLKLWTTQLGLTVPWPKSEKLGTCINLLMTVILTHACSTPDPVYIYIRNEAQIQLIPRPVFNKQYL